MAPGVDPFELNEELDPKESVGPMEEVKCCNSLGLVGGTAIAGVSLAFSPTFRVVAEEEEENAFSFLASDRSFFSIFSMVYATTWSAVLCRGWKNRRASASKSS